MSEVLDNVVITKKTFFAFFGFTIFCAVFGFVYEFFSHNVFSAFMMFGFFIPLIMAVVPLFIIYMRKGKGLPCVVGRSLYYYGVITLTVGSLYQGVLDIYGTTNKLINVYWVAGSMLIITGVGCMIALKTKR